MAESHIYYECITIMQTSLLIRKSREEFDWSVVYTKHQGMHFTRAGVAECKADMEERTDCETWH